MMMTNSIMATMLIMSRYRRETCKDHTCANEPGQ